MADESVPLPPSPVENPPPPPVFEDYSSSQSSQEEDYDDVDMEPAPPAPAPPPAPAVVAPVQSAPNAPPPLAPVAPIPVPVLRGRFATGPDGITSFRGLWTMSENDTITSSFEYVKRANAPPPTADGSSDGTATRAGDPTSLSGTYDGYFMMKRLNLPELRVAEPAAEFVIRALGDGEFVEIAGVSTALQPGDLYCSGSGKNDFGTFELRGRFVPATQEVTLAKAYTSVTPAPLVSPGKRPGSKPSRAVGQPGFAKRAPKPKPAGSPPTAPRPPKSRPMKPSGDAAAAAAAAAAADAAYRREQRKRVVPSHLREGYAGGMSGPFATCAKILDALMNHQFAYPFLVPVDPVALGIPDYPRIIKRPMDLGTIKHKLENGAYLAHEEFADDARTVFLNAMTFNAPSTEIYAMADRLKKKFEEQWKLWVRQMDREAAEARAGGNTSPSLFGDGDSSDEDYSDTPLTSFRPKKPAAKPLSSAAYEHKPFGKPAGGGSGGNKKRVRLEAAPAPAPRPAAPQPSVVYVESTPRVSDSEFMQMQMEMQALKAQVRLLTAQQVNTAVASQTMKLGELTYEEKRELTLRINQLDADKLAKVVQIIAEHMPLGSHAASEDIEIDIDSLDVATLRRLQEFVKAGAPKPKRVAPPPAKTKAELQKAAASDLEMNKARLIAMEKAVYGSAPAPAPQPAPSATRPVGGYGSDSDSGSAAYIARKDLSKIFRVLKRPTENFIKDVQAELKAPSPAALPPGTVKAAPSASPATTVVEATPSQVDGAAAAAPPQKPAQ